jgi:hypothetical protein
VSKGLILEAVKEGIGPRGRRIKIARSRKTPWQNALGKLLVGKGWLPAILR